MIDPKFQNLTSEQALAYILKYEKETDELLSENKITDWEAWECYFGLMYESNCWMLAKDEREQEFLQTWERLRNKIDVQKFNPFLSKNPTVILVARDILARHNIKTKLDN